MAEDVKVIKTYKHDPDNPVEISLGLCIKFTEGSGFYGPGAAKELLEEGYEISTPYAYYKLKARD